MLNERKGIEFISHLILDKIEKYKSELGQIYDDIKVLVKYASLDEIKQLNDLSLITGYLDFVKSTVNLPRERSSYYTLEELLDKINGVSGASSGTGLSGSEGENEIVNIDVRNELEMYEKLMELAMSNDLEAIEDSPDDSEYIYDDEYTDESENNDTNNDSEEDEDIVDKYADFVYEDEDTNYLDEDNNEDEDPNDYEYEDGEDVVYEDELTDEDENEDDFVYDEDPEEAEQEDEEDNEDYEYEDEEEQENGDYDEEDERDLDEDYTYDDNTLDADNDYDEEDEKDLDDDYTYDDIDGEEDTDEDDSDEEDDDYEYDDEDSSNDPWAGWTISPNLSREQLDSFTEQQIDMLINRGMLVPPEDEEQEDEEDYEYDDTGSTAGTVSGFGTGVPIGQFIGQFDDIDSCSAKTGSMTIGQSKPQAKPVFKDSNVMRTVAMFDKLRKKYDKQQ